MHWRQNLRRFQKRTIKALFNKSLKRPGTELRSMRTFVFFSKSELSVKTASSGESFKSRRKGHNEWPSEHGVTREEGLYIEKNRKWYDKRKERNISHAWKNKCERPAFNVHSAKNSLFFSFVLVNVKFDVVPITVVPETSVKRRNTKMAKKVYIYSPRKEPPTDHISNLFTKLNKIIRDPDLVRAMIRIIATWRGELTLMILSERRVMKRLSRSATGRVSATK